MGKRRHA
jgi:peptidyl-prolyl cis-trans isomerase-like 2